VCIFAAELARDLAVAGRHTMIDYAPHMLEGMFGGDFSRRLRRARTSSWTTDPFSRGSYSWALPGHVPAREQLNAPVDDRIFFAGEAVSVNFHSTVLGVYLTGFQAAIQILALQ
jgi:monoamine oxidase